MWEVLQSNPIYEAENISILVMLFVTYSCAPLPPEPSLPARPRVRVPRIHRVDTLCVCVYACVVMCLRVNFARMRMIAGSCILEWMTTPFQYFSLLTSPMFY